MLGSPSGPRAFVNVTRHCCNKAREPNVVAMIGLRGFGSEDISNIEIIKETLIEDIAAPILIRTSCHNGITPGLMSATLQLATFREEIFEAQLQEADVVHQ